MLARQNNLDIIPIQTKSISLRSRSACGKITHTDGTTVTEVYDTIELLFLEEFKRQIRTNDAYGRVQRFVPMYQDFFLISTETPWIRRHTSNNNYANMTREGRTTLGAGIYYQRTKYELQEDEHYYYIVSTFDMFSNNLLDDQSDMWSDLSPEYYLSNQVGARCPEEDTAFNEFKNSLTTQVTRRNNAPSPILVGNDQNLRRLTNWMHNNRIEHIKAHATDVSRANIERTRDGLVTCVAISKDVSITPRPKHSVNSEKDKMGHWDWFQLKPYETVMLYNGRLTTVHDGVPTENTKIITTTDSFGKRRNTKMFTGILNTSGRFTIANVIATNPSSDTGSELLRLMKTKVAETNYPTTDRKELLSKQALLSTHVSHAEKVFDKIKETDGLIFLPSFLGTDLVLQTIGPCEEKLFGTTLQSYSQLIDGVYKIHFPTNVTLRKANKVYKMKSGTYRVCTSKEDIDIIQYMSLVGDQIDGIEVELVKSRIILDQGNRTKLQVAKKSRPITMTKERTLDQRRPDSRQNFGRRTMRKAFGIFPKKAQNTFEEE